MSAMPNVQLYTARGEALRAALAENPAYKPWDVYPRPQLVREGWINLNGYWDFCAVTDQNKQPRELPFDRKILVPFPVESALSGIGKHFPEGSALYYRTRFTLDALPAGKRLLLHCGGVNGSVTVVLNGKTGPLHVPAVQGPLTYPLDKLRAGENELLLIVRSDLRQKQYPYGKNRLRRGGMWYTPATGVWQTVWLEWVPETCISALKLTPTLTEVTVVLTETFLGKESPQTGDAYLECEGVRYPVINGRAVIRPQSPRLWTPEDPYLYGFTVKTPTDEVRSYFALRTYEVKTVDGVPRLLLNGEPIFLSGLLDQGYWPDGLYTPASPECYADDILAAKRLGFQMLRKHIKIEPEQFYYDCDRLGMAVFQDMVNNGRYSFFGDTLLPTLGVQRLPDRLPLRRSATKESFRLAMQSTVRRLYNHPCILYWTIFNEGWGQFSPSENYELLKTLDPTRVIDTASGWFRGGKTDVESRHVYFRRFRMPRAKKPVVLSEFGGYVWKVEGHSFNPDKTYGYRLFRDRAAWQAAVDRLYREQIEPNLEKGLCAAVYTQLSDVEDETNGLLTYDRKLIKPQTEAK